MSRFEKLPVELLVMIASYLEQASTSQKSDLCSFCLVARTFLAPAREIIYRNIKLGCVDPHNTTEYDRSGIRLLLRAFVGGDRKLGNFVWSLDFSNSPEPAHGVSSRTWDRSSINSNDEMPASPDEVASPRSDKLIIKRSYPLSNEEKAEYWEVLRKGILEAGTGTPSEWIEALQTDPDDALEALLLSRLPNIKVLTLGHSLAAEHQMRNRITCSAISPKKLLPLGLPPAFYSDTTPTQRFADLREVDVRGFDTPAACSREPSAQYYHLCCSINVFRASRFTLSLPLRFATATSMSLRCLQLTECVVIGELLSPLTFVCSRLRVLSLDRCEIKYASNPRDNNLGILDRIALPTSIEILRIDRTVAYWDNKDEGLRTYVVWRIGNTRPHHDLREITVDYDRMLGIKFSSHADCPLADLLPFSVETVKLVSWPIAYRARVIPVLADFLSDGTFMPGHFVFGSLKEVRVGFGYRKDSEGVDADGKVLLDQQMEDLAEEFRSAGISLHYDAIRGGTRDDVLRYYEVHNSL